MSAALDCLDVAASPGGAIVLRGVTLSIRAGGRSVLVGPSGAGKTTLLRAIAGLQSLDGGDIMLGGRSLSGLPPHRRRVAVVFQEPRLLPHLSVVDNVALPLRAAGFNRTARRTRAQSRLEEVGLSALLERRIQGLSGGEQHRVALARALCAEPDLLLLDEPLAALDPNRREELRGLIVRLQASLGLTTLIVTHDRAEAAELGERVALMLEGRIVQHDEPRALFERPVSAAVARFFGVANLLRGDVRDGRLAVGRTPIDVPGPDGTATLAIRPEHVSIDDASPLRGRVLESVYSGTFVKLTLDCAGQRIHAHVAPGGAPAAGALAGIALPAEHLWRLPPDVAPAISPIAPHRAGESPLRATEHAPGEIEPLCD